MLRKRSARIISFLLLIIILISFSSGLGYFSTNDVSDESDFYSPVPNMNDDNPILYSQANLTQTGSGKNFNYYETTWGIKNYNSLNENSVIDWELPGSWLGNKIDVSIANLKTPLTGLLTLQSFTSEENAGSFSGNDSDTHSLEGITYQGTWWILNHLDFVLKFQTNVDVSSMSSLKVATYSNWTNAQGDPEEVEIFIQNFTSGYYELLGQAPESTPDWANYTKSSGFSDYISGSREIWIKFNASAPILFQANEYDLDYAAIEIVATHSWTRPQDVNLTLNDGFTDHNVTGSLGVGSISITGNWTTNPKYFLFGTSGETVNFDATSIFFAYQNKSGSVTSIYTLNLSHPVPSQHQWQLSFYQDPYPSANYTNLNFSISTIPIDWTLENATDPGGSQQSLAETSVLGGTRVDADTGDITPTGGTWNLFYYSPNYIADIEIRKDSNLLPYNPFLLVWDTIDIRSVFSNTILNGNVNLTVSFEGSVNHNQENESVSGDLINFESWQINSTTNRNGTYLITISFFNTTEIGIYTTQITVGFPTNLTIFSPDSQYIEFLKGEVINLTVFFENLYYPGNYYNERGINKSRVKWEISNLTGYSETGDLTPNTNGYYNASLDTGSIGVWDGSYNLTVTANKTNYENQTYRIELLCFQAIHPTYASITDLSDLQWISGANYSVEVFPNQSITIQMNYTDTYANPQLVDLANISAYLYSSGGLLLSPYITNGTEIAPGVYEIDFSNLNLHIGQYTLLINLSKKFYDNSSIFINYTVDPLKPIIEVSKLSEQINITSYTEWENLTISFKVEYNSTQYNQYSLWDAPVDWALVKYYIVSYGGDPLNPSDLIKSGPINITPSGIFEIKNEHLSNGSGLLTPGEYEIYIQCNATDCEERWYDFNLTILKKINVSLSIDRPPSKFIVDHPITIIAKLYSSELPSQSFFDQKTVKFNITVYYNSYPPRNFSVSAKADPYAEADVTFSLATYVPNIEDIIYIEYFAYFEGYEDFFPVYSFYSSISQTHRMNVNEPFPLIIIVFIIIGIAAGATILLVIQRKVLAPKQAQKAQNINYLFTAFKDVVGIQHLFVVLKSTGDCIISKIYSPEGIEDSMQMVLCDIIANYGKSEQNVDAFCDLIRFKDFLILLDDGDFIRAAITVSSRPSDKLIRSLIRFVQFFELQNYQLLKSATDPIEGLKGVDELLDLQFGATLISPYTISNVSNVSGFNETLALMAIHLMEKHGYFFLSQLCARAKSETLVEEMMIFSTIQYLLDKKVIVPYIPKKKPTQITKKLSKTEFERLKSDLSSFKIKAVKAINENNLEAAVYFYHEAASLAGLLGDVEAKNQFLAKARSIDLATDKLEARDIQLD